MLAFLFVHSSRKIGKDQVAVMAKMSFWFHIQFLL